MWGRPRVDYSQLPANPPNPQENHAQLDAAEEARHHEWERFITFEVLRCINAVLHSATFVSYKPRMLTVEGTRERAVIYNQTHDITWAWYLVAALDIVPEYNGYVKEFYGIRNTGKHWRSGGPFHESILLSIDDLIGSAQTFINTSRGMAHSFRVDVRL